MVQPRRFWAKDPDVDYDVLSDEEWEEEPDGEELDGSDGDDDGCVDEVEDYDGFMVAGAACFLFQSSCRLRGECAENCTMVRTALKPVVFGDGIDAVSRHMFFQTASSDPSTHLLRGHRAGPRRRKECQVW